MSTIERFWAFVIEIGDLEAAAGNRNSQATCYLCMDWNATVFGEKRVTRTSKVS